jgi:hypothetical protein
MRSYPAFTILSLVMIFSVHTLACDCMNFANAQQAAQKKNVIIAKVETISNDNGKARVRIEKVFKGDIENVYLDIQGQDGGNCNGENIPVNQKGILLFEKSGNGYQTLVCATTNIPQKSDGFYEIHLGEEFLLTEKEIKDVLAFKLQATVKSAECQIMVNRMAVPYDSSAEMNFDYNTTVSATPTRDEVTTLKTTVDLSSLAPKVGELFFYAEIKKTDVSKYDFSVRMKDPFTGIVLDHFTYQVDLRKNLQFAGPSMNRFTDLAGNPLVDSQQPFLSHQTHSFCALNLGQPLELVK